MTMDNNILNEFINGNLSISNICKKYKITLDYIKNLLIENEYYYILYSKKRPSIINFHNAAMAFVNTGVENTTFTYIAKQYKVNPQTFKKYLIEFYPNVPLKREMYFDETVFDSIDTEEKAYWLGFIFADGTISSSIFNDKVRTEYKFELSLSSKDYSHLRKFALFLGFKKPILCDDVRCRILLNSKHLWEILNSYGCTPRKSLTLKFPDESIFIESDSYSKEELIRHFIRGYFDGDGCLTWGNKEHTIPEFCVIGTTDILSNILQFLNTTATLRNNNKNNAITKVFSIYAIKAVDACSILYNDSKVFLDRKYNKYIEFCRLYGRPYRELQTNNGEGCDVNPVISTETKESVPSYRVETEPSNEE